MRVLSIVHPGDAGTELFAPVIAGAGHHLDEWIVAEQGPPPDGYGAVLVFGGSMHVDQVEQHPWLRDETDWLRKLLEAPVPTLGICLGSQLLALVAGAEVGPLDQPERGWHEVELTEEAASDPVLSSLPERFDALQWHHYAHALPEGAVALARNDAGLQAFRLGATTWGVQFHPEVTQPQLERWFADKTDLPAGREQLQAETRRRIGGWNELGRWLCRAFLGAAEERG